MKWNKKIYPCGCWELERRNLANTIHLCEDHLRMFAELKKTYPYQERVEWHREIKNEN